jgi:transposase
MESEKGRDKVEKRIATLKSTVRIRPVFLEKDEEIAALVFVIMFSLLIHTIIEMRCRKRWEKMTVRQAFLYLNSSQSCAIGSKTEADCLM